MAKRVHLILISILILSSCGNNKQKLKPLSLLDYGIAMTIMVPDSAKVIHKKLGLEDDITIDGGAHYKLQIFVSDVTNTNAAQVLSNQKELVKQNPFFKKIIKEQSDGFLFESAIDSTTTFGFRRVKIMGDKEIIFREPLIGTFNKEEIETLYQAVDGVKKKKK